MEPIISAGNMITLIDKYGLDFAVIDSYKKDSHVKYYTLYFYDTEDYIDVYISTIKHNGQQYFAVIEVEL